MKLIFLDMYLVTHPRFEPLLESWEIDVAFLLCVEYLLHQGNNFLFSGKNFVFLQMVLEVFVRNEAVTIDIHLPEDGKKLRFAIEGLIFNLNHQVS